MKNDGNKFVELIENLRVKQCSLQCSGQNGNGQFPFLGKGHNSISIPFWSPPFHFPLIAINCTIFAIKTYNMYAN